MKKSIGKASIIFGLVLTISACGSGSPIGLVAVISPVTGSSTVTPAAFAFSTRYAAPRSALTLSGITQVKGLAELASVSLDANAASAEFRVCADASCAVVKEDWRATVGILNNDDFLQLRLITSSIEDTAITVKVHVGAGAAAFIVNTESFCEKSFTQTDHFFAATTINGQNGWFRDPSTGFDEQIENVGAIALAGTHVWKLGNKVVSGAFANQSLSPQLSASAGESSVRSTGGGDAMETVFWMRPVSASADGSTITVSMSPAGADRQSYFRIDNNLDANGGFQTKIIDYYDAHNTGDFRTFVPSTAMNRTTWTKVRLVLETLDGGSNDIYKIFLNDQLVGTHSSWEDYHTWALGGNSVTESVNRLLFRVAVLASGVDSSFVDANSRGFQFDNLCYRVYNRATPASTIQFYRTGFEP